MIPLTEEQIKEMVIKFLNKKRKEKMITWLKGKKTIIISIVAILSALTLGWDGKISWLDAYASCLAALSAMGIHSAIVNN
jgi:hypothetical protein